MAPRHDLGIRVGVGPVLPLRVEEEPPARPEHRHGGAPGRPLGADVERAVPPRASLGLTWQDGDPAIELQVRSREPTRLARSTPLS